MEDDIAADPVNVGLLGSQGVVLAAHSLTDLVEEFEWGHGGIVGLPFALCKHYLSVPAV